MRAVFSRMRRGTASSTRPMRFARRAKRIGLVDEAVPLRILENTARMITLEAPKQKELSFLNKLQLSVLRGVVVSQARKQVAKRAKREHYPAPYAILELWR